MRSMMRSMMRTLRLTTEPSTICRGVAKVDNDQPSGQATGLEEGRPGTGDRPTVGHVLVRQPQGEDEKIARSWDHRQRCARM